MFAGGEENQDYGSDLLQLVFLCNIPELKDAASLPYLVTHSSVSKFNSYSDFYVKLAFTVEGIYFFSHLGGNSKQLPVQSPFLEAFSRLSVI